MNLYEKIKHEFEKFPEIEIVIVFGSAVKNQLTRQSDIDIAFAQKKAVSYEKRTQIYIALEKALKRDIDLIDLHQVNGHILKNILCGGDVLIKKSVPLFAFFLKKMWYNQADMMPYTRMILEKQVNGFING
ncbi:MAG: nucleotidyltransferase domain-containing protein [Proteobacteria bacterium]|nr:nucleotidyltransferase domain-containing protein [Pseudomonadota bacterium]MBU1388716.1 nucleotidyltransferase domain-containing protein [Pseudomonadota bacterium]MBU1543057.1 nucleotidyltransferase domain-containing protein [Pseudomonadota bacterium]